MAKKKGGKAKKSKKETSKKPPEPSADPLLLFSTYATHCKIIGLEPHDAVRQSLTAHAHDNPHYGKQILISSSSSSGGGGATPSTGDNEHGGGGGGTIPFTAGNCRALATAILGKCLTAATTTTTSGGTESGTASQKSGTIYTALKELRLWQCPIGDDGVLPIAELLRLGGAELQMSFLELMAVGMTHVGAKALGRSLMCGMNRSLVSLNLDFNATLGTEGVIALCHGLRTNSTLKKISLKRCNITGRAGGKAMGEILSFPKSSLSTLDLTGNRLNGDGLHALCFPGLLQNTSLVTLHLPDNNVHDTLADKTALPLFAKVLSDHVKLQNVNFMHNLIGEEGGKILMDAMTSTPVVAAAGDAVRASKIVSFRNEFAAVQRSKGKGKGKKKKGGGKKKKKRK